MEGRRGRYGGRKGMREGRKKGGRDGEKGEGEMKGHVRGIKNIINEGGMMGRWKSITYLRL